MFYDTHEVDNALLCQQCEGRLDIPKILPCGKTICSLCEITIRINDKMFDCMLCKEKHEMPKLRSDVQLKAEEVIQLVNDLSSKIIEEIDEYEKESIEFNRANLESLGVFKKIANELESFHSCNTEYLKNHVVDYDKVIDLNKEANILIKKAELEVKNLKDVIFDGKFLVFEENKIKIIKSILGSVKIDQIIDSLILINISKKKDLLALCEFPVDQKWNLIYRASRDGFEASSFHSKCDDKPNTLVIIKSTNGNVFGGYTEQSWNLKSNSYSNLGQSFIHPDYASESNEAKSFLAGSYKFLVSEIEVYTKQ